MQHEFDVTVLGAGPAGMIAMLRLAKAGYRVLGLETTKRPESIQNDLRSTAFLLPSVNVLEACGALPVLLEDAVPLETMAIVDLSRGKPLHVSFHADEIGQENFGFNIMNDKLKMSLLALIDENPNIELRFETQLEDFQQFSDYVDLVLNNGRARTRLLIGAEGRNSPLREKLEIKTTRHIFDQWAQVFTVTHEIPHKNTSTEIHLDGGPMTFVPCPDIDGMQASAIVWMDRESLVRTRLELDPESLGQIAYHRSNGLFGPLKVQSKTSAFPMMTMAAHRLRDHRAVIIGESAHVVPPIGAQGLNMSLRDLAALVETLDKGALSNPKLLIPWERARLFDIRLRRHGIRALNDVSIAGFGMASKIRYWGLQALDRPSKLRKGLMYLGLGASRPKTRPWAQ